MASAFKDLIQSPQFTFFIGKEGEPVTVHAAALAATSPQLNALINGGMRESENQCAQIEDIELDDFMRVCEYAYRGDYTVPLWEEALPSSANSREKDDEEEACAHLRRNITVNPTDVIDETYTEAVDYPHENMPDAPCENEEPVCLTPLSPKVEPVSRTPLRADFENRNFINDNSPRYLITQHFEPTSNANVHQNFTPVLLAHAKLYCFAHFRMIAPLKELTLDKLQKTLLDFKLYAERIGDVIELARFTYSNPNLPGRNEDGTVDPLRKLVLDYIVCEIDTIGKHDGFVEYMEEGGQFVGDFWGMAKNYMV